MFQYATYTSLMRKLEVFRVHTLRMDTSLEVEDILCPTHLHIHIGFLNEGEECGNLHQTPIAS